MSYSSEPTYIHGTPEKCAVLLLNLGTPDAPTAQAVKPYLREFLGDPRVVEIPRLVWWCILNGIILNVRPKKSAAKYASIWMPEGYRDWESWTDIPFGGRMRTDTENLVNYQSGWEDKQNPLRTLP